MNQSSGAQRQSRTFIWKTPRLNSFILHSLLKSMRKEHKRGSETELGHICLFMLMCTFISSLLAFSIMSADPGPTCCCPLLDNTRRYRLQTELPLMTFDSSRPPYIRHRVTWPSPGLQVSEFMLESKCWRFSRLNRFCFDQFVKYWKFFLISVNL